MTDRTTLGDRMKGYEAVTRSVLPRRTYTLIRVDGRVRQQVTKAVYRTWWEARPAPHFSFDLTSPLRDMIPEYATTNDDDLKGGQA